MRVTAAPIVPYFAGYRVKSHKPEHVPVENTPPDVPSEAEEEEAHEVPLSAIYSRGNIMDLRA